MDRIRKLEGMLKTLRLQTAGGHPGPQGSRREQEHSWSPGRAEARGERAVGRSCGRAEKALPALPCRDCGQSSTLSSHPSSCQRHLLIHCRGGLPKTQVGARRRPETLNWNGQQKKRNSLVNLNFSFSRSLRKTEPNLPKSQAAS